MRAGPGVDLGLLGDVLRAVVKAATRLEFQPAYVFWLQLNQSISAAVLMG